MPSCREDRLYVIGITEKRIEPSFMRLDFHTTRGDFRAFYHTSPGLQRGVIFICGSLAEVDGPASIYPDLARDLLSDGIASLMVSCRVPHDCAACSIDTLLALQYMDDEALRDVALVGWSFGGVVALYAGSFARNICGVAAISTFDVSEQCLRRLSSKPILLLHGESDEVSPVSVACRIHDKATGPRSLNVYANAGHNLVEVKNQLRADLQRWIIQTLKPIDAGRAAISALS